jgi:hypothetical protein
MVQINNLAVTVIPEVLPFHFLRPGAQVPYVAMPDVNPTTVSGTLDVGSGTMKAPMPLLVAVPALAPTGALFVLVIGAGFSTLTAVEPC